MSYFQVTFNSRIDFDSGVYNTANYSITPALTISSIEQVNEYTIKVNVTSFDYDTIYNVQVYNIKDVHGTEIFGVDPSIALVHIPFVILSATAIDSTTINIEFGGEIPNSGEVLDPSNYVVTGATTPSVVSVTYIDTNNVQLTVAEMRNLGAYTVTASNVLSTKGTSLTVSSAAFTGIGIAPQVTSATSLNIFTVRVVFNEPMSDTGLTTDGNYAFTCPAGATITVGGVAKVNSTTVDITTAGEMRTGTDNYSVTVSNVTDSAGNVIDPAHDSDTFDGIGLAPQVSGAAYVGIKTCTVTFNENMDTTTAETPGNYSISGPTTPNVVTATLAGAIVTLVFDADMVNGDYTVTVSNVTDTVGNVIDPAHDTGTYTAVVARPLIMFGGRTGAVTYSNETWAWVGGNWVQRLPAHSPSVRGLHTMVYDSNRNVIVLFGGYDGGVLGDTWEYDGSDWTQKFPAHSPTAREEHGMAYDASRNVVVLFGGTAGGTETWEYNGTDWTQKTPAHNPSTRWAHGMTYDSVEHKVLLYGGTNGAFGLSDFWQYDGTDWTARTAGVGQVANQGFIYDPSRQKTVTAYGWCGGAPGNITWEYTYGTDSWANKTSAGVKPSSRYVLGFAYSPDDSGYILFGGDDGGYDGETWYCDPSGHPYAWTQLAPASSPSGRMWHSMVTFG